MSTHHGQFTWCELMTTDVAAATGFYGAAIGWSAKDAGMLDRRYMVLNAGDTPVGGTMDMPQPVRDAGGRPGWIGYISVDDVDAMATRVGRAGGTVHHPAAEIPGVGRFATVADPQGAVFTLFKPSGMAPPPSTAPASAPGHVGWYELQAADWRSAFAFYADLFGWTKTDAVDMGPIGTYQMFATGGATVGGMMTKTDAMPMPAWMFYFNVDGIDAAVSRAKDAGGQILNGPMEVPGGSWIAQGLDPQGAMFAMVGPKS